MAMILVKLKWFVPWIRAVSQTISSVLLPTWFKAKQLSCIHFGCKKLMVWLDERLKKGTQQTKALQAEVRYAITLQD